MPTTMSSSIMSFENHYTLESFNQAATEAVEALTKYDTVLGTDWADFAKRLMAQKDVRLEPDLRKIVTGCKEYEEQKAIWAVKVEALQAEAAGTRLAYEAANKAYEAANNAGEGVEAAQEALHQAKIVHLRKFADVCLAEFNLKINDAFVRPILGITALLRREEHLLDLDDDLDSLKKALVARM